MPESSHTVTSCCAARQQESALKERTCTGLCRLAKKGSHGPPTSLSRCTWCGDAFAVALAVCLIAWLLGIESSAMMVGRMYLVLLLVWYKWWIRILRSLSLLSIGQP